MSFWSSVLTPGLVAAGVTLVTYSWIQRPRADLRMVKIGSTLADAERLYRAGTDGDAAQARQHWMPLDYVRLTNYGDGTAYDIRLSGNDCRPRVWVDDYAFSEEQGEPPVIMWPMWSDNLSALEPGQSVTVLVMSGLDTSRPKPVLEVSWPRLPRRGLGRKSIRYDLADARNVETGWPGKRGE